jgi:hypothetical protein
MHNQHAQLSQVLAEQRRTELQQATHAGLARSARRRRRKLETARGWWLAGGLAVLAKWVSRRARVGHAA